ncbi:leucine-rich repeat protein [Plasmodium knowlesi strain H]|uniref:Leucine-rich repeat protein n=3 Tax=Plasmodium knowlesi TaxID=5850 RepID=A0A5K1V399_PLAKH|nr:leucine-rich repeat protein [Plasmodium knowlesi strain H]OTN67512.1 Leucine-rich repeat protein [Plasmodium knowlesi]CAA9987335.1 leucine-rich repeat protein [Plasmodium knowlesi strain H]SBO23382.1 leucine-rich repeat protein [Plasmodium knowlesi strain H]SBO24605.1 leucine-rich repeat protein [Plasmodium knowlesi strain H]VVS76809.1 leucine-rich repeat protein [Plasmodium knowlesi strain H]|eukprot:XP_002258339.1 hypothetical protein, conserved in Plasmodium species [Plasmodium knowlesi strain H]
MREDPHGGECEKRVNAVMHGSGGSREGVHRGIPLDVVGYHREEGNFEEEWRHPGRTFVYMERADEPPGARTKLILNFKKLNLKSEDNFSQMVRQNRTTILDALKKAEIGIGGATINNIGILSRKNKNIELEKCDSQEEATNLIMWELDLSCNYFIHLSIDNILCVLIQNEIISEGSVLRVHNLKTINIRKNVLIAFPYWGKYELDNLLHLCLSHNEICELPPMDDSPTSAKMETRKECAMNVEKNSLFVDKIKGEHPGEEGALNWKAPNLTHLYLQNNKITSVHFVKYLLNGHKNISHINISFNRIKWLSDFPFLPNLKHLDLSFNTELSCLRGGQEADRKRVDDNLLSVYDHQGEHEQNNHARSNFLNIPSGDHKKLNHQNLFVTLKYFSPNLENLNLKHTPLLNI